MKARKGIICKDWDVLDLEELSITDSSVTGGQNLVPPSVLPSTSTATFPEHPTGEGPLLKFIPADLNCITNDDGNTEQFYNIVNCKFICYSTLLL